MAGSAVTAVIVVDHPMNSVQLCGGLLLVQRAASSPAVNTNVQSSRTTVFVVVHHAVVVECRSVRLRAEAENRPACILVFAQRHRRSKCTVRCAVRRGVAYPPPAAARVREALHFFFFFKQKTAYEITV